MKLSASLKRQKLKHFVPRWLLALRVRLLYIQREWNQLRQMAKDANRPKRVAFLKAHRFRYSYDYAQRVQIASDVLKKKYGMSVLSGPFKGLKYIDEAFCSTHPPKILGCYEDELAPVMDCVLTKNYRNIINIGSAEGYYAVGLAWRLPDTRVYAYEIDDAARALCMQLAELNEVAHCMDIRKLCTIEELNSLDLSRSLIICDCEGEEFNLMQPKRVPGLKQCDLLIEMHDCFDPRVTPALVERFSDTHDIIFIDSALRSPQHYPEVHFLPLDLQKVAVDDGRSCWMQWAFMTVRAVESHNNKT